MFTSSQILKNQINTKGIEVAPTMRSDLQCLLTENKLNQILISTTKDIKIRIQQHSLPTPSTTTTIHNHHQS
jgi:hypothetical protein